MKRRHFLALGLSGFPYMAQLLAMDFRGSSPESWKASSINEAAMALYGREKFSTIKKSTDIELTVPRGIVKYREEILITIRSSMKAKNIAIFQDANPQSLVAVFNVPENSIIDYEFNMRMVFKGTVFAVVEGMDGKLYYVRKYIDIPTMSCMASGG